MIYIAGCRARGSNVLAYREELQESQWWDVERQEAAQLAKLRTLLAHAREHAPFYREHFERHGFDCAVDSLAGFRALPSLGKKEIASRRDAIQNAGRRGRLIYSKTAGTTGVPFFFHRTSDWDAQHRAAIARGGQLVRRRSLDVERLSLVDSAPSGSSPEEPVPRFSPESFSAGGDSI
jgi:phenylacetate-coenzyme A ligase PaaK-like adenylate-forming protein